MCVHAKTYRIPRGGTGRQHDPDGPHQNQGRSGMAIPEKPHRRPLVSRLYRVLSLLHPQLLTRRTTLIRPDEESDPMVLGRGSNTSLSYSTPTHQHMAWAPYSYKRETSTHKNPQNPASTRSPITRQRLLRPRGTTTSTKGNY